MSEGLHYPDDEGMSSGWSGSATSRRRSHYLDSHGITTERRREYVGLLYDAGVLGMTSAQIEHWVNRSHGAVSGVLTGLHSDEVITRLSETRKISCGCCGEQEIYILPEFVQDRQTNPYQPNAGSATERAARYSGLLWKVRRAIEKVQAEGRSTPQLDTILTYLEKGMDS